MSFFDKIIDKLSYAFEDLNFLHKPKMLDEIDEYLYSLKGKDKDLDYEFAAKMAEEEKPK